MSDGAFIDREISALRKDQVIIEQELSSQKTEFAELLRNSNIKEEMKERKEEEQEIGEKKQKERLIDKLIRIIK